MGFGAGSVWASTAAGAAIGSIVPGVGNVVGAVGAFAVSGVIYLTTESLQINDQSPKEWVKDGAGWVADQVVDLFCDLF